MFATRNPKPETRNPKPENQKTRNFFRNPLARHAMLLLQYEHLDRPASLPQGMKRISAVF